MNSKQMMIIGIDPGTTGAIAIELAGKIQVYDMPKSANIHEIREMLLFFDNCRRMRKAIGDCVIVLESVHSMPRDGNVGSFRFGFNYGVICACVAFVSEFDHQVIQVRPQDWKKLLGLSKDKNQSLELARANHPELIGRLNRKKDHNRAEAILIIDYFHKLRGVKNG